MPVPLSCVMENQPGQIETSDLARVVVPKPNL